MTHRVIFLSAICALAASAATPPARLPSPAATLPADIRESLAKAIKAYDTTDEALRLKALAEIAKIPDPCVGTYLTAIARFDGHPAVRQAAIDAMASGGMKAEASASAARLAIAAYPPQIRRAAAATLRKSQDFTAIAFLDEVLANGIPRDTGTDPYNGMNPLLPRLMAAEALGVASGPQACKMLGLAIGNRDAEIRAASARAIGDTGNSDLVPALVKALADADLDVRIESIVSLGKLGGQAACAALLPLSKDPNEVVARFAARALKRAQAPPPKPAPKPPPAGGGGGDTRAEPGSGEKALPDRDPDPQDVDASEIVFLVDTTATMNQGFTSVVSEMLSIISKNEGEAPFRAGVVAYRGANNQYFTKEQFLSYDLDRVRKFVEDLKATGGNVEGTGLERALNVAASLNWKIAPKKTVVVIADDAPTPPDACLAWIRMLHDPGGIVFNAEYVDRSDAAAFGKLAREGGGEAKYFYK